MLFICTGFEIRIEAYPDSAQRLNFARTYLASAACAAKLGNSNADGGSSDGASPIRSAGGGISFTDHEFAAALAAVDASDEATSLAHEAHCYELAAHLTWAIWGVCQVCFISARSLALLGSDRDLSFNACTSLLRVEIFQASKSEIAFGFSEYALARFREFRRIAAEVGFQI